jgi:hypothetical protein
VVNMKVKIEISKFVKNGLSYENVEYAYKRLLCVYVTVNTLFWCITR